MDTTRAPIPGTRAFVGRRTVRLADMDARGRVRLDAVARFLQDVAIDDVGETGWGAPEHLWFVRRIRVDVLVPLLADRAVELTTWCSGVAAIAAGRRWSVKGDHGGHAGGRQRLDPPRRGRAARPDRRLRTLSRKRPGASSVSTRFELPDPPTGVAGAAWALRSADVDLHGHVNNAVHWQAVEHALIASGAVDPNTPVPGRDRLPRAARPRRPRRARPFRRPRRRRARNRLGRRRPGGRRRRLAPARRPAVATRSETEARPGRAADARWERTCGRGF